YYQPEEADTGVYLNKIKAAVKNGAKLIVCPGYLPEEAVYKAQDKYPKVHFILLDGTPHNADYSDTEINDNVMPILFEEDQAGFLAGYAAVRDGYTHLGFIGGVAEAPVIRYGYGYVQGADYAAIEMGTSVDIKYCYSGTFIEDPDVQSMASSWYQDGTEVIFACGAAMNRSVMSAAEGSLTDAKVIGVDIDQSAESPTVITSAMKMLSNAVYGGIKDFYDDSFKGGEITTLTAKDGGVGLPMETSVFRSFTSADYDEIFTLLVEDVIVPYASTEVGTTDDLTLVNTTVNYISME
ncbi:MAG TPA: BMP family ABC transporter substrate-binding protein, partial [Lachnospiraceae bacterium]|nr:BMP family ABC transporter substrate-binding protein [Lachnospiraceae bacterium]